jgi:hypothetical protein
LLGTERFEPARMRLDRKLGGMARLRGVRSQLRILIGVLGVNVFREARSGVDSDPVIISINFHERGSAWPTWNRPSEVCMSYSVIVSASYSGSRVNKG